jgi:GAF domain-containing protein
MTRLLGPSKFWLLSRALLIVISLSLAGAALAQTAQKRPIARGEEDPIFHDYRGVKLGWLADEVRKKLGDPANKADDQDYYIFNENERAQVYYDKSRQVTAISVDFMTGANQILTPQQVFGAEIEAKTDGSKSRLVRYPKAGYWVSYSRTAGDTPIISVTIQKMQ